ncbi:uncharacterized [Tachysurus ichikawai]
MAAYFKGITGEIDIQGITVDKHVNRKSEGKQDAYGQIHSIGPRPSVNPSYRSLESLQAFTSRAFQFFNPSWFSSVLLVACGNKGSSSEFIITQRQTSSRSLVYLSVMSSCSITVIKKVCLMQQSPESAKLLGNGCSREQGHSC